jgi:phospholipid/cholesterol/gamma-HCH transport system substrate-binding protein
MVMLKQHHIEFLVGLFMVAGLAALSILAFRVSGLTTLGNHETYQVTAEFTNIGDLKVRAPVTIAGVTIGRVVKIDLDPQTFKAIVSLDIDNRHQVIPIDSTANIFTAGLIGSNYISITPGFENEYLKQGGRIENTNQALILQNLIGQLMFNLNKDKDKDIHKDVDNSMEKEKNKLPSA